MNYIKISKRSTGNANFIRSCHRQATIGDIIIMHKMAKTQIRIPRISFEALLPPLVGLVIG